MKIWVDETLEKYGAPNKSVPCAFVIGHQHVHTKCLNNYDERPSRKKRVGLILATCTLRATTAAD